MSSIMPRLSRHLPIILTMLIGISASLLTAEISRQAENQTIREDLKRSVNNLAIVIQRNIDGYAQTMYSIQSFYAASSSGITQAEFTNFIEPIFTRLPGIDGFDVVVKVPNHQRAAFEKAMSQKNYNFHILEEDSNNEFVQAGDRPFYFPITLSEPLGRRIVGYDILSNSDRRDALETALKTREMVVTSQVMLTANYQPGFLLVLPIYSSGLTHSRTLEAVAIGSFSTADIVQSALKGLETRGLNFIIYNTVEGPDKGFLALYNSQTKEVVVQNGNQSIQSAGSSFLCSGEATCTRKLEIGNQQWSLVVIPTPAYETEHRQWASLFIFIVGFVLTGSLVSYLWIAARHTERVELLVDARETALKQLEDRTDQLNAANQEITSLNHRLQEQLTIAEVTAITDALTQLANRRCFEQSLQQEWQRLARLRVPLSVMLCDVDYFKRYNDTYGHLAGDSCLQLVAEAIQNVISRPSDLVARYGGEEFVVILPETPLAGAIHIAEKLRRSIHDLRIIHSNSEVSEYITMSIGVASQVPNHTSSPKLLIELADQALYSAKQKGRNCIECSTIEHVKFSENHEGVEPTYNQKSAT